jgi:hypothetical protein
MSRVARYNGFFAGATARRRDAAGPAGEDAGVPETGYKKIGPAVSGGALELLDGHLRERARGCAIGIGKIQGRVQTARSNTGRLLKQKAALACPSSKPCSSLRDALSHDFVKNFSM